MRPFEEKRKKSLKSYCLIGFSKQKTNTLLYGTDYWIKNSIYYKEKHSPQTEGQRVPVMWTSERETGKHPRNAASAKTYKSLQ